MSIKLPATHIALISAPLVIYKYRPVFLSTYERQMESKWLRIVQALAIISIAALCNVSLVLLAPNPRHSQDQVRAGNAKLLMAALEKYRSTKGAYPLLVDKPITDLKSTLVDGGFLKEIPRDLTDAQPMRYVSHTGTSYGILSTKNREPCLIEVGVSNTGWWGLTSANLCSYD